MQRKVASGTGKDGYSHADRSNKTQVKDEAPPEKRGGGGIKETEEEEEEGVVMVVVVVVVMVVEVEGEGRFL